MHAGRATPGPYSNATGASITDASMARTVHSTVKALGYFFPTDMRDDSAVCDAISTKLHADAEHIAREPAPPGVSAWPLYSASLAQHGGITREVCGHPHSTRHGALRCTSAG